MSKETRLSKGLLKISEIAEKANVLSSTIRHYTDIGLLQVTEHTDGGHRLYEEQPTLEQLAKIQHFAKRGLSLPEIKAALSNPEQKRLLVIDDEQEVAEFILDLLQDRFPGQIKLARDGFSAGRMLDEFLPDLVILDLHLPGIDGFQVCQNIRSDPDLKGIKILAITGYDTAENAQRILASGADAYLAKPLDAKELPAKICELLNISFKERASIRKAA